MGCCCYSCCGLNHCCPAYCGGLHGQEKGQAKVGTSLSCVDVHVYKLLYMLTLNIKCTVYENLTIINNYFVTAKSQVVFLLS